MNLNEIVIEAGNGDENAMCLLIDRFKPLILKYSKELKYEEAQTDLIISLIETTKKLKFKISTSSDEPLVVHLIHKSLKNKKIDLYRKYIRKKNIEVVSLEKTEELIGGVNIEDDYIFMKLLDQLNTRQKNIIILKFIYKYSDIEIAKKLKISRQAVNQNKNKALNCLKKFYEI